MRTRDEGGGGVETVQGYETAAQLGLTTLLSGKKKKKGKRKDRKGRNLKIEGKKTEKNEIIPRKKGSKSAKKQEREEERRKQRERHKEIKERKKIKRREKTKSKKKKKKN